MIIREYVSQDTCGRNRVFVDVQCIVCTSIFSRQKRQLKEHTCSLTCNHLLSGRSVELHCDHCDTVFIRAKSKLNLSKSGKYFCSRICKDTAQKYMLEIQPEHYGKGLGEYSYRDKAFSAYKPICNRCGFSTIKALEVHHKDSNRKNNDISNLEILCANCHCIEHLGN
jgi:hypothetical protein